MDTLAVDAQMIAMLPCADIDRTAALWTALGLTVTYRQLRPNPFVALERGGIALQYYGLDGLDPELNHATCGIVVDDTEPLHRLFTTGSPPRMDGFRSAGSPASRDRAGARTTAD